MRRLTHSAWLSLGFLLAGCVVPIPGSLERADHAGIPSLESLEEGVVVLSTTPSKDEHGIAECVRKGLQTANPSLRIVSAREFRGALFPWLDLWASSQLPRASLSEPLVGDAIAKLNVRYAIFLSEETQKTYGTYKGSNVGAGVGWKRVQLTVSANVWDMKRVHDMGLVEATASGGEGGVGIVPFVVIWVSELWGTACRGLGDRLGRMLTPANR